MSFATSARSIAGCWSERMTVPIWLPMKDSGRLAKVSVVCTKLGLEANVVSLFGLAASSGP